MGVRDWFVFGVSLALLIIFIISVAGPSFIPSVSYVDVGEERGRWVISYFENAGFESCGEFSLSYGENRLKVNLTVESGAKCLVVFRRPEPRDNYVLYWPHFNVIFEPLREEDYRKPYYVNVEAGVWSWPEIEASPQILAYSGHKTYGQSTTPLHWRSWIIARPEGWREDAWVSFTYKAEDPEMRIRVTIEAYATILRTYEEWTPPPDAPRYEPGEEELPPPTFKDPEKILTEKGYKLCREYTLDPGKTIQQINYTVKITNPYKGIKCYIKIKMPEGKLYAVTHQYWRIIPEPEGVKTTSYIGWGYAYDLIIGWGGVEVPAPESEDYLFKNIELWEGVWNDQDTYADPLEASEYWYLWTVFRVAEFHEPAPENLTITIIHVLIFEEMEGST